MNNLFQNQEVTTRQAGANQLGVTNQLTNLSSSIANEVFTKLMNDAEANQEQIKLSQEANEVMDELISANIDLEESVDIDFLKDHNPELLERVLKSQQSKRSRAKSQLMTQENYLKLMTAAVAENLVRIAIGKPKGSGGRANGADPTYSEEELEKLSLDPAGIAKAIRNVQSKKSIAKSKADFDPESDRWQALLEAEEQLKNLRAAVNGSISEETKQAVEAKEKADELLADVDPASLKADEAKALLLKLQEALAAKQ